MRWLRLGDGGLGPMKALPPWFVDGVVLTGRQLAAHGVTLPVLHPERVLLLGLTAR